MKEQLYENFGGTRTATSRMFRRIRTLEWLALMQHYGAPTRLLDFTYSFWIALFFAFEEAENDCSVVALDPSSLGNKEGKNFNSILQKNIEDATNSNDFLYADVPFFTNERLAIQKGIFVFSLNLGRTFHDLLIQNQKVVVQLMIPAHLFQAIRFKLNDFNCNSRVLFPGIDGYARYFKNHTSNKWGFRFKGRLLAAVRNL